jgi:hypothetical protein
VLVSATELKTNLLWISKNLTKSKRKVESHKFNHSREKNCLMVPYHCHPAQA